jgi:hypothetical protein
VLLPRGTFAHCPVWWGVAGDVGFVVDGFGAGVALAEGFGVAFAVDGAVDGGDVDVSEVVDDADDGVGSVLDVALDAGALVCVVACVVLDMPAAASCADVCAADEQPASPTATAPAATSSAPARPAPEVVLMPLETSEAGGPLLDRSQLLSDAETALIWCVAQVVGPS